MTSRLLFSGITVLDLTKVFSGPLATRYLADHGATVIKIEPEELPDPTRFYPPLKNGWSGYFEILNRNKQSINLNLKEIADYQKFIELVKTADVIVENMLPNVKTKLNIEYQTLKQHNPKIIVASLAGIDQNTNTKYYDLIAQAESGLLSLTGTPETPTKIGPSVVDAFSGANLAFAISSALFYREKNGIGQEISVSMLAGAMNLLEQNLIEYSVKQRNPKRPGNHDTAIAPFGVFKTSDGFIALAIGDDKIWNSFIAISEQFAELQSQRYISNQNRLDNLTELVQKIESIFSQFTTTQLVTLLKEHVIPCASIREMSDVASHEWFYESQALKKIEHPKLGTIIIPGNAIQFSTEAQHSYINAPELDTNKNV